MYKIFRLALIIFTFSYFLGNLWHIYVCDMQFLDYDDEGNVIGENFVTLMLGECVGGNDFVNFVKVWYFAVTTLATIGYGDFSP